ncbi:hypothetical protein AAHA92_08269 [Salvia divinorum]|uniref:Uncharacterized protein n=1 Tax=Salvia divinorum TaxID=28513 RepID=A0ABD1HMR2_SALDI
MGCLKLSIRRRGEVLKVVKVDGEVMEFESAVFVKELLVNFEGFGVKRSRKSGKFLEPSFELQLGKTYYLFPWKCSVPAADGGSTAATAVKRVKIVMTKKQLEELLSEQTNWKPGLLPIPEEMIE